MKDRVYLYDSTLRDGAQTSGIDFTAQDKSSIALKLDEFGIDYIEGGWPGANPTDDDFFGKPPKLETSKLAAFGMTRRASSSAANDPGLAGLINSGAKTICIVGKSWDFHIREALNITLEENLEMVSDSIKYLASKGVEVLFDVEHFFDGYKANKEYTMNVVETAYKAGARWVVLCDTNGGILPHEVTKIVADVTTIVPGDSLAIHCHNDTGNAVANSLAAVEAGVRQIQGTINGVGERCGNANLIAIIPTLVLKMGFDIGISQDQLAHLAKLSHFLDDKLNRAPDKFAPYVGESAFAHKAGLHVSAISKNPACYEHISPDLVGNTRKILVSDQSGRSNIIARLKEIGFEVEKYSKDQITTIVDEVKKLESQGYAYDNADASFELLAHRIVGDVPTYFKMDSFRVIDERRWDANGKLVTLSEATAKVTVDGKQSMTVATGNGPVNALDLALRNALTEHYPALQQIELVDYKVRIINSGVGTEAITRVLIETKDKDDHRWTTIGVSSNIIDASYNSLRDSIIFKLMREAK